MVKLSSDRLLKPFLHEHGRRALGVVVGLVVLWRLVLAGWPWWAWLPATLLAVQLCYGLLLAGAYGYQKATYQRRAQLMREQLRRQHEAGEEVQTPRSAGLP